MRGHRSRFTIGMSVPLLTLDAWIPGVSLPPPKVGFTAQLSAEDDMIGTALWKKGCALCGLGLTLILTAWGRAGGGEHLPWRTKRATLELRLRHASRNSTHPGQPLVFAVEVYNYAGVPTAKLEDAQREAARIIRGAGVKTVWLYCTVPSSQSNGTRAGGQEECNGFSMLGPIAILRILNRSGYKGGTLNPGIFGYANGPFFISILYDRVAAFADADDDIHEAGVILGDVMAHEFGHLLLGPHAHSRNGIMRGRWDRAQLQRGLMGGLRFTPEQSRRMRDALLARRALDRPEEASGAPRGRVAANAHPRPILRAARKGMSSSY